MPRSAYTLAVTIVAVATLAVLRGATDTTPAPAPSKPTQVETDSVARSTFEGARGYGGASVSAPSNAQRSRGSMRGANPVTGAAAETSAVTPTAPTTASKPRARTSGTPDEFLADALFRQLDEDEDGTLRGREIPTALRAKLGARRVLTADTFTALFVAHVTGLREGQIAQAVPKWFAQLNSGTDGRVSRAQWEAGGRSSDEFIRADADGDGFVSRAEVVAFAAQPASATPIASAATTPGSATTQPATPPTTLSSPGEPGAVTASIPQSKADELFEHYVQTAAGTAARRTAVTTVAAPNKPAASTPVVVPVQTPALPPAPNPAPKSTGPKSTLPEPLDSHPYLAERNRQNLALLESGTTDVLFLGDSITDGLGYGAGKPLWDELYAPLPAFNFGIGGITTSNVIWQIETGQVARAAPKVVVLLIGSNNLGWGQKPGEVFAGVEKIINSINAQLPDTEILLLGILPRGFEADNPFRATIPESNRLLADLEGDRVTYRDIGSVYLSPDNTISPTVMPDGAHPNLYGYQLYTLRVWEPLTALLPKK